MCGSGLLGNDRSFASNSNRVPVNGVYIHIAVVKTITTPKGKIHGYESVVTGESEAAGEHWILVFLLHPTVEDIA
jgi:hypothetical protein